MPLYRENVGMRLSTLLRTGIPVLLALSRF